MGMEKLAAGQVGYSIMLTLWDGESRLKSWAGRGKEGYR
jgi:hypothetical protein